MSMTAPGKRFGQICPKRPMAGPGRLTDEQRALASDPAMIALAELIARRFARHARGKLDEFRSAALEGLCRAAMDSDPAHPGSFRSYAGRRMRWAILKTIKASNPAGFKGGNWADCPRTLSLDLPDEDGRTLADSIADHHHHPEGPMHQANGHANGHPALADGPASGANPPGVRWDKKSRKWVARIALNGQRTHLGSFPTRGEASDAYESARQGAYASRGKKAKPGPKPKAVPKPDTPPMVSAPETPPVVAGPPALASSLASVVAKARVLAQVAELLGTLDRAAQVRALASLNAAVG
jgi:hypothetical protein